LDLIDKMQDPEIFNILAKIKWKMGLKNNKRKLEKEIRRTI